MFYTNEIKVYRLIQVEDEWGIMGEEEYVFQQSMPADIQPYSQEKLNKEYGYDLQTTKRLFVDTNEVIDESSVITYRGKPYSIVKIVEWDDYLDIALDDAVGVELNG